MYDQETDPRGDYYIYIFNARSFVLSATYFKLYSVKIFREYYCYSNGRGEVISANFLNN